LASGSKYIALMIWNLIFINQPYRRSEDNSRYKDRLDYYVWLAKLAEKGKITSVFFADTYGFFDTYEGKPDAQFRGGSHTGTIDPVAVLAAMAMVTKSVSFAITGSTTYISKQ
jgi:alkanesulfonate monooxygenase SsuD/methylene tetrahydromethanopterin reductase-like flavin-dependent oxidoreductase (luciferase family)